MSTRYAPDKVSPPGWTLEEILEEMGMKKIDLATRLSCSEKHISQLISGAAAISEEHALGLERALGVSAGFWLRREANYREFLAREHQESATDSDIDWSKEFPCPKMASFGWIPETKPGPERVNALLNFFGVATVAAFQAYWKGPDARVQFRRSLKDADRFNLIAAWLRRGEIEASTQSLASYDAKRFEQAILEARQLTTWSPQEFWVRLQRLFNDAGVCLVMVPELPGCVVWGAARWVNSRPVIQLSLRYKDDGHLWFSLFHEAAHILKHSKKRAHLEMGKEQDAIEEEANRFAADLLIPSGCYNAFIEEGVFTAAAIKAFAESQGLAAGIVVGRLQHDEHIPFQAHNKLKSQYRWKQAD